MVLSVPYNRTSLQVPIPEQNFAGCLEPKEVAAAKDSENLVKAALQNCSGNLAWDELLHREGSLLVIVNDGTRPTPTKAVLEVIADDLAEAGAHFIVASGTHREPTEEEFRLMFGSHYERFRAVIHVHDARNDAQMVYLGKTPRGTECSINRIGAEADRILAIGSVEPHYFAGYTGGRKAIFPGIASYRTIEMNHSLTVSPEARLLNLKSNPVHLDMVDSLTLLNDKKLFGIMTVMDKNHDIYEVTAGDIITSFDDAVAGANRVFTVRLEEPADIVIACAGYPMDIDLYQSQKALENGKLALAEGGILLLVSACRDGTGDSGYMERLSCSPSPEQLLGQLQHGYRFGDHKAAKIAETLARYRVWAKSELNDELLEKLCIRPVHDLQAALDEALLLKGPYAKILLLPDASMTVPLLV